MHVITVARRNHFGLTESLFHIPFLPTIMSCINAMPAFLYKVTSVQKPLKYTSFWSNYLNKFKRYAQRDQNSELYSQENKKLGEKAE